MFFFIISILLIMTCFFLTQKADTKGRKVVLIATLLLDGFCGLLSSVAQYYSLFMFFRFFNGFGFVEINLSKLTANSA